jgi:hypothetical protein
MKSKSKMLVRSLFLSLIMLVSTGCTVGIKEKNNLIFVSPVPIPAVSKGSVMIATNAKIPLAIIDQKDKVFYESVQGYVLVDPFFYELLIKTYNGETVE